MLEIIVLIFLSKKIGALAIKKGLKPGNWKATMVIAWLGFEILGAILGIVLLGENRTIEVMLIALCGGFGGFLLVKYILEKKPDIQDDIEQIGSDSTA